MIDTVVSAVTIVILAALLLLAAIAVTWRLRIHRAVRRFTRRHGPAKDLLVVYTASPHWQPWIEERWLPRWGERLVLFNRTHPWSAEQPEAALWQLLRAGGDHTPMAVVVRPWRPLVFRLYRAFLAQKEGRPAALQEMESRISAALER